jgi:hypothetical protein
METIFGTTGERIHEFPRLEMQGRLSLSDSIARFFAEKFIS